MAIETLSGTARQIGLPQVEASRCVELARLPQEEFAEHISAVKEEGELSTAALLRRVLTLRRSSSDAEVAKRTPALPDGAFDLLYADPPWQYEFGASSDKAVERH